MNEKSGVVATELRSDANPVSPGSEEGGIWPLGSPSATTWASQYVVLSMIEWKYMNGSCRVAYPSPVTATSVPSAASIAGCPQAADSLEEMLPMSCM